MAEGEIKTVAVLGAGTMGHGIAQIAAVAGYSTRLYDLTTELLEQALEKVRKSVKKGIELGKLPADASGRLGTGLLGTTSLEAACDGVDLVIEAVPESLELKREVFADLDRLTPPGAILASNTSSIGITEIAAATLRPERVLGMHFFNPPPLMKLLELIRGHRTSEAALATARSVGERLGKTVIVARDVPGFATSRLGIALGNEAMRMVEQGVATPEDIDTAMELGYKHPMGPFRLSDLVGLDVRLQITEYLYRELGGEQFRPPLLLKKLVAAGKLGQKTGEGFYKYER